MIKLKKGDLCKIIVIGKKDVLYRDRKKLIGKKFYFIKRGLTYPMGSFIGCKLKSLTRIELSRLTIFKNQPPVIFFMVKLKKL